MGRSCVVRWVVKMEGLQGRARRGKARRGKGRWRACERTVEAISRGEAMRCDAMRCKAVVGVLCTASIRHQGDRKEKMRGEK